MFKVSQKGLSTKEVLDICIAGNIDARTVCRAVPQGVNQSAIFVVDLKTVGEGDLTTDGNGVYARHSCPTELVQKSQVNLLSNVLKDVKREKIQREIMSLQSSVIIAGILLLTNFVGS